MTQSETCKSCLHFALHYIKKSDKYYATTMGHCAFARIKRRTTDTRACEHYFKKDIRRVYKLSRWLTNK